MAKNIEMNIKNTSGYDVLYPKTIPSMVENLLNDDTKEFIGLTINSTPDDAFRSLYLNNLLQGKAYITLTVLDNSSNLPMQNVIFNCNNLCDKTGVSIGNTITTDENGKVSFFVNQINPTVSLSGYADINNYSSSLNIPELQKQYILELKLTTINFKNYTSSTSVKFSGNVSSVDVSCCGGGGGGGQGTYIDDNDVTGGGGGGGGYAKTQNSVTFNANQSYSLIVGDGGAGGDYTGKDGSRGGNSSFLGVSANGGNGGIEGYSLTGGTGGGGNGVGGDGAQYDRSRNNIIRYSSSGGSGSGTIFSSFTNTATVGGGGGGGGVYGGGSYGEGSAGGNPKGGDWDNKNGFNYGGGGAGGTAESGTIAWGGTGGAGCVAIRMHLKSR